MTLDLVPRVAARQRAGRGDRRHGVLLRARLGHRRSGTRRCPLDRDGGPGCLRAEIGGAGRPRPAEGPGAWPRRCSDSRGRRRPLAAAFFTGASPPTPGRGYGVSRCSRQATRRSRAGIRSRWPARRPKPPARAWATPRSAGSRLQGPMPHTAAEAAAHAITRSRGCAASPTSGPSSSRSVAGAGAGHAAPTARRAQLAAAIYAFSLSALLGVSALYHRVNWRPAARRWMRRLDHTMIFVLIAGTYTPFALLVLHGTMAQVVLIAVWACAGAGAVLNLIWWDAPKPVTAAVYLSTGWIAVLAFPQLWAGLGPVGFGLLVARRRPLHGRRRRLRAPPPRSAPRGLRLPRDLPPAGDRRGGLPVRRDRDLRAAHG